MASLKDVEIRSLTPHRDARGGLVKILMRHHLPQGQQTFGEIYISWAAPGAVKANHYHRETHEWFCLLLGEIELVLEDPETGERRVLHLRAEDPKVVMVPPGIAHAFRNVGNGEAHLLAYADRPYDAAHPDTIPYQVIRPKHDE
ncbi:MAG: cupin domain-containing protein [Chloroflexi bacterium]|nr:cupin domain-containing protein [Chloroflexota bacterium]